MPLPEASRLSSGKLKKMVSGLKASFIQIISFLSTIFKKIDF